MPSEVSIKSKLGYALGHFYNDLCANMWFSYLIIYMNKIVGLSPLNSGILLTIGQISDAIATVIIGLESDRIDPSFYGKRMIWHFIGSVCVFFSFPFIFNPFPFISIKYSLSGHWTLIVYYIPFIIIFQVGWAAVQTAHLSLIADMSPSPYIRTQLNSIRNAVSVIAGVSVYSSFFLLLLRGDKQKHLGPNDYAIFRKITFGVTSIGAVFSVLHHVLLREPVNRIPIYLSETETQENYKYWLRSLTFYRVSIVYALARAIANVCQIYIILYLLEIPSFSKTIIASAPLVIYFFGFLTSLCMTCVLNKYTPEVCMTVSISLTVLICSCTYVVGYSNSLLANKVQSLICCAGIGIITNVLLISSFRNVTDIIGSNKKSTSFIMGFVSFVDKILNGGIVLAIQFYAPLSTDNAVNDLTQNFYKNIMAFVPSTFSLILLIMVVLAWILPYQHISDSKQQSLLTEENLLA